MFGMNKTCTACDKSLPLDSFTKNAATDDGYSYRCRSCQRQSRIDKGLQKPSGWARKTADMAEYRRAWREAHPGYFYAKKEEWLSRRPERRRVKDAVRYALKTGKLVRQPCHVCGLEKAEAHHPDYSRPLDVVWLCRPHHLEVHSMRW